MDVINGLHWSVWLGCLLAFLSHVNAIETSQTVYSKDEILMECTSWDDDDTMPVWQKDDEALEIPSGSKSGARIYQAKNGSLVIARAVKDDAGVYTCPDSDEGVEGDTYNIEVIKFIVKDLPKSVNLVEGQTLELECEVDADNMEEVTLEWKKGGEEVDTNDPRVTISGDDDGLENTMLTIEKIDFPDRDEYTCVATLEDTIVRSSTPSLVRIKDKLAPLWPFLGICANLIVVVLISFCWDRHHKKKLARGEHDSNDTPPPTRASEVRHRRL